MHHSKGNGAVTPLELMCYHSLMHTVTYHCHRFPAEVIQRAVWLYFRIPLSFRDVEDLLAERGSDVSYETVRRWSVKFGLAYARKLRRSHPRGNRSCGGPHAADPILIQAACSVICALHKICA